MERTADLEESADCQENINIGACPALTLSAEMGIALHEHSNTWWHGCQGAPPA